MNQNIRKKIVVLLFEAGKNGMKEEALLKRFNSDKKQQKLVRAELNEMLHYGHLNALKGSYTLRKAEKYFAGTVTRAAKTHGFVMCEELGEEVFIRGRDMLGSVPGDRVIVKAIADKDENNRSMTAVVMAVTELSTNMMTGIVVDYNGEIRLAPSTFMSPVPLVIVGFGGNDVRVGDKVRFEFKRRGDRHSEHVVTITEVFGSSEFAKVSVSAYLEEKQIRTEFPDEVLEEAKEIGRRGITGEEKARREDLRDLPIFTIDGADTKDIDDAVSLEKTENGYKLGVHIADVSHYVKRGTALEKEAFDRGTSVYIADRVIPMLPKELSNGICSLNPDEERLAFSCLMEMDKNGIIKSYRFAKTLIRSRVKGVYSEINEIIDGTADEDIKKKYAEVIGEIPAMKELADILVQNRKNRGAPEIESVESKIVCDEDGVCIDIHARQSGISEAMIEEFMLSANNCAARVGMENQIPFVYRVHEPPSLEKVQTLAETLTSMGFDPKGINEHAEAAAFADLLERAKEDPRGMIINRMALRTMMKAKYSEQPLGHFGLVMKEYAHFTSPIRRLADLSIHRILTEFVTGDRSKLEKRFTTFAEEYALRASTTEVVAVCAERDCEKFYAAEFMKKHVGEEFDAVVSGVISSGFFVELPNTVEGRVDTYTLPEGVYEVRNEVMLVETLSNTAYAIGDKVHVKCAAANPGAGTVDFVLASATTEK